MFCKYLTITASGLLIHLIGIVLGQIQFPCPDVFQYVRDEKTGDIEGLVTINHVPTGVALRTTVELSIAVVLPTKYIGSLEFAESKEATVRAIHMGRPLIYRVRFPLQQPLPVVTRILLNDQERCSGSRAIGHISTTIRLDHNFYPPGVVPQLQESSPLYQRPKPPSISIEQTWITSNLVPVPTPNSISVGYWNLPPQGTTTSAPALSDSSASVIPQSLMTITDDGLRRETVNEIKSPCPNVFRYVRDPRTGDIEGYIEISGVPIDVSLHIKIGLSVAASLPTKYVGRLELALPKDLMIEAIRQGQPLTYRVHFPLQRPLPLITRVLLNNKEHCSGERAIGRISTSITLEHNLFTSGVAMQPQNPPMQDANVDLHPRPTSHSQPRPTLSSQTQSRPTPPSYTKPSPTLPSYTEPTPASSSTESPMATQSTVPVQNLNLPPEIPATIAPMSNQSSLTSLKPFDLPPRELEEVDVCGRPRTMNINLLVSRGNRVKPGDWPWMVGIFVSRIDLEFQCGGSLVSDKHVLTAAHCLINTDGTELPPSALLVAVGRYRLRAWTEKGSMTTEVSEYHLHAEYRRIKGKKDNDIAIVTLMETMTFGRLITPICLWSGPTQIDNVVGKTGFVAGWGRDEDENPTTQEPRMVKVPIVSQEECLRSNKDFVDYTSNRTFCGGARNGSGPCNGDSGGGLVIYDPEERRYYLRGVVSLSLLDRTAGACDLSNFVVYTDAAKYTDWIRQKITV